MSFVILVLLLLSVNAHSNELQLLEAVTSSTGEEKCVFVNDKKSSVVEVRGTTSSGTGTAAVDIKLKSSAAPITYNGLVECNISLTLGTAMVSDWCLIPAPWSVICADVTSISGTGASVSATVQY